MENVTWKKRTILGIMSATLLLGGVYTATGGNEAQVGEEVSAAQAVKFASTKFKTTDNLNLRTGAGVGNRILLSIPKGTQVTSNTKIGVWHKVTYKGKTGYVSGKYLTKVSAPKASPTPKATASKMYQTTDNLNMRTGGSVKYKRILTIPRGGKVEYISKSGSWYKVKYNGKTGFVSSAYLKAVGTSTPAPKPTTPKPAPQVTGKTYQTTAGLNMRTGGSVKHKIVLTIPKGGKVQYISKSGVWYKVKYNGKTGFVSSKYLKAVGTSTPAPKPTTPKPAPQVTGKTYQTTDNLNMRTGGSVKYKIITTIPRGGKVEYISKSGSWFKVKYKGKTGFVSSAYLKAVTAQKAPAPKPAPKPEIKQDLMTRAQAEAHVSSYMKKDANGYSLMSDSGRFSVSVNFPTNGSGKAHMSVDGVSYISGVEIKPEDFGQQHYDEAKAHLAQMNSSIKVYAESQFGVGSKEANTLVAEVQKMTLEAPNGQMKKLTLQGVTITIAKHGISTNVFY